VVTMRLVTETQTSVATSTTVVATASPILVTCASTGTSGTGDETVLTALCPFDRVPIGPYAVDARVSGGYYVGAATGALQVVKAGLPPRLWLPRLTRP
jgi:hypothetical protein